MEKTVELIPRVRRVPRVIGPGRRERNYLSRLDNLQERLTETSEELRRSDRELDLSVRLERGCQRLIDRMEVSWSEDRGRLDQAQGQQKRLILTMGALQRENELLRERLELAAAPTEQLTAGGAAPGSEPRQRRPRRTAGTRRPGILSHLMGRVFRRTSER